MWMHTRRKIELQKLSDELFQSDYDSLATQYAAAIGEAFEGLPEQLATLGAETARICQGYGRREGVLDYISE